VRTGQIAEHRLRVRAQRPRSRIAREMGTAIIEGLHMLFAIFWFGGTMWANFVLGPATARTSAAAAGEMGAQIGLQANRVIPPVAGLAIILGFLRGTVWGPVTSANALFGTGFGRWWLIALVLAVITFIWGQRLTGPSAASIALTDDSAERAARIQRTLRLASIELLGFLGIFSMMILMRFYP
jgi:uncharacterized membrane protein